jgi:hypothetical protein
VLHPSTTDVWIAHPFSLSPTAVAVATETMTWWAPCLWCAGGIVALAAPNATIHTRLAGEIEPLEIRTREGELATEDLLVHFALPPRDAWANVVHWCSTVLPFRREDEVDGWCARHRLARGRTLPLRHVLRLGRAWYGRHLARDWVKWTTSEAREIFRSVGLTGEFWSLPETDERF